MLRRFGVLVVGIACLAISPDAAFANSTIDETPYDMTAPWPQAPFGDKVGPAFKNYLRASPYVGTAGAIAIGGIAEAKALGFKTIINLVTAEEGAREERARVEAAGLGYIWIPIASGPPTPEQVAEFAGHVGDPANYPILVHCQSANRVGAIWALYRAAQDVPPAVAVQEGRTIGLKPGREAAVRERLGLLD